MKIIVWIARLLVAATFIFSGFVKLVDPLGSAYKFEEYFSAMVLDIPFLVPYALPFSIVLIIIEIMLGVMLLVGFKPKLTTISLFGIMLVFIFLTWYSAYFDKVTDCGCFGDAVKLTAWETFYKNIVLIILVIFLMFVAHYDYIKPVFKKHLTSWLVLTCLMGFLYLASHVLIHLPIIDFRPYAIGKNIPEGMNELAIDGLPKVHDFYLETEDGEDIAEQILAMDKVALVIAYDLDKSEKEGFVAVSRAVRRAKANGYEVYGLSASYIDDLKALNEDYNMNFDWLFVDGTVLKTIIRANPGLVTLSEGTVTGKWNWGDIDEFLED